MWSFGWGPQEAMSCFQEEMAHFFDASVVFKFFCMKFITFYPGAFLAFPQSSPVSRTA